MKRFSGLIIKGRGGKYEENYSISYGSFSAFINVDMQINE